MSVNYDNWARLVGELLDREKLMRLAMSHSRTPSSRSSSSYESSSDDSFDVNKCCLLAPKALQIAWGDDSRYWNWTSRDDSRSPEVAELKTVWWLDIRGKIETRLLSPETTYAAFLRFKLAEDARGLEVANATIRFVNDEQEEQAEQRATTVHLQPVKDTIGRVAVQRRDGWMEVEIGNFSFQYGYEGEVEARLLETTGRTKTGLILEGIEFRQVYREATFFPNRGLRNRERRRITSSKINESFAVDWEKFLVPTIPLAPSPYQDIVLDERIWYMLRTLQISWGAIPSNWRRRYNNADNRSEAATLNHMRRLKTLDEVSVKIFSPEILGKLYRVHGLLQEFWKNAVAKGDKRMEMETGSCSVQRGYEGELETLSQATTSLLKIGPAIESNLFQAVQHSDQTALSIKMDLKRRRARGKGGVPTTVTSSKIDESFAVNWERFVMPDYQEMVSPSIFLGFLGDAKNGKICCMIGARGLQISWGDNTSHWQWNSQADSRFSEVAELRSVWWLEIRGRIDVQMLSPRTFYAAYLVFRLDERPKLEVANTMLRFVDDDSDKDAEKRAKVVRFQASESRNGENVVIRDDGWMEIEMGNFYLAQGDEGEVEARLLETTARCKSGLIVRGIEFRPTSTCIEVAHTLTKVSRVEKHVDCDDTAWMHAG